jgi:N-acetylglucosamine-6-phosphate deacetylase
MVKTTFSGNLLWPDGQIRPGNLTVEGDKISSVSESSAPSSGENYSEAETQFIQVPEGYVVAPGYIDLHINGAFGHDFTSNPRQITAVARNLPRFGITSFLPTLVSSSLAEYTTAIEVVREIRQEAEMAATLGLHLEGPYLNRAKASVHVIRSLRSPDTAELLYFDPEIVRIMTLSPELPGAMPFIRAIRERGILVGIGHSTATFDETLAAVEAGASWGTHLFNGMGTLHHRHPGIVGALLTDDRLRLGLIADKVHIHPALLRLVAVAKQAAGVTLVSKAVSAAGMGLGKYKLGSQTVQASSVGVRLPNGALAGSLEMLDQAVRNMALVVERPLAEALQMASQTPAELLTLTDRGKLAPNYLADIIILDKELRVSLTMVRGTIVYRQPIGQP